MCYTASMPRISRVVIPGLPHHVTQRGNRRLPTFFQTGDYTLYLEIMAEWCRKLGVEIWAYCLMSNHVHLVAVPDEENSLARAIGEAHRRYTSHVNKREGWTGHLWQGRFASCVMDEDHLLAAARYIERNPVRARMVGSPSDYRWSSIHSHLERCDDILVNAEPLISMMPDWQSFIMDDDDTAIADALRIHSRTGRPLGSASFLKRLETTLGRPFLPKKRGPKTKQRII